MIVFNTCGTNRRQQAGLSYMEVIIATLLISVSLVPAIEAVSTGVQAGAVNESQLVLQQRLHSRMEELLAQPFSNLDTAALAAGGPANPSSYSDPIATPDRRLVYLARYDGDNADGDNNPFSGVDVGLLWVRVSIENTALAAESLTTP